MSDCLAIYHEYPKKVGRQQALIEIEKALKRLCDGETGLPTTYWDAVKLVLDATKEFARSPAGQRGQYTPWPQTWFHQSRYLDDRKCWYLLDREEEEFMARQARANVGVWRPT